MSTLFLKKICFFPDLTNEIRRSEVRRKIAVYIDLAKKEHMDQGTEGDQLRRASSDPELLVGVHGLLDAGDMLAHVLCGSLGITLLDVL